MKQLKCTLDSKYLKLIIVERINRVDFLIIYIYFSSRIIINALLFNRSACKYFPYPFHFQPVSPPPLLISSLYIFILLFLIRKMLNVPWSLFVKAGGWISFKKKKKIIKKTKEREITFYHTSTRDEYIISDE